MNESNLIQMKIIVERAVRPVRASTFRKRNMREELLAHVSGVFEEELARLGDERAALERAALRFGQPAEVMSQLQELVPRRDVIRQFWEGQPTEPTWQIAFRLAWVSGVFALLIAGFFFVVAAVALGWVSAWPREVYVGFLGAVIALPVYLAGLTFLTEWMEKALYGPTGRSRLKVALVALASTLFMLVWLTVLSMPAWSVRWDYRSALLVAGSLGFVALGFPYVLAKSSHLRKRYHDEWAHIDIA
jgi:hypothetical protein